MGSAINLDEIKRFEVTEVYSHPDAKVDIVLVHGLNGDPRRTWTSKENGVFWPTQLLPVSLKSAQARILVYGYNADVYTFGSGKSPSSDMLHHHAQSFIANLALERKSEEVEDHPIIFVAHSLGGILVKRALELSNDLTSKNADDNRSIFVSTYGIIFLGTPHNGADPAKWGMILQGMVHALVPKKVLHSESQLVKTLQSNNETLQNINLHFLDIYQKFKICMVHEAAPTDLKGTKSFVVDKDSAAPLLPDVLYFGIESSHSGMAKFESKNSPGYMNVSTTIKSWVQECGPIIQARWENERRQRWQIRQAQAAELLGAFPSMSPHGSTGGNTRDASALNSMNNSTIIVKSTASIEPSPSNDPSEPPSQYFIKPSGFRPNSLFEGRRDELAELHKMLFDKKRRAEGTSAVLIQSMPGGGKSHLAREYVYRHKSDFPGGIFWLRAKSIAELAAGFWEVARKAALNNLDKADELGEMEKDADQYIRVVRRWFNHRRGWLLVFDGIHFNETNELRKFIPDSVDTGLIYTSTEKSVSGNHLFMNPQVIKLPLLSAREAQRLLLLELDRKEPFAKDDLKHSMELVQAMGFLPVVIHAVAQRLKSTREPLARYARKYANEPHLRGLGSYMDVVAQLHILGASETLNLMHILCFFSQHIPVEMISLGLKALDEPYHVPVKASEPISGTSLNNTFKMLNTFALIDRNEQEAVGGGILHSSQSSKSSRDMLAENVDVIRLHAVVQGFFVDTLVAAGSLPIWLDHAVRLFCCSYDRAHERITRKVNAGLVEDYRLYEIHGLKIREHLTKNLGKHPREDEKLILEEAQVTLESRLQAIKSEIERRTPESSHVIAVGRPDVFQTSIFDRTSSSSGPETPGSIDRHPSQVSTWGLEIDRERFESPTNLLHGGEFGQKQLEEIYRQNFPMPMPEDTGYDSDRESAAGTEMTAQPSQQTARGAETIHSPGWETVHYHRPRPNKNSNPLQHRSIRALERQRYRDSAGAYRAVTTADPRLTKEFALGSFQSRYGNEQARGRIATSAEISLAQISKNSPPSARGDGMIRSTSQQSIPRMMTGLSSYAAAVAGSTKDTILGWKESAIASSSRPSTSNAELVQSPTETLSPFEGGRLASSAMESLQKFPIELASKGSPTLSQTGGFTPLPKAIPFPPYPTTPSRPPLEGQAETLSFPDAGVMGRRRGESMGQTGSLRLHPYPTTIYPRMEGGPAFETLPVRNAGSSPRAIPISTKTSHPPQGERDRLSPPSPSYLSLSFPDIRSTPPLANFTNDGTYYPGRPEFSFHTTSSNPNGYTSQPMSRDPSGQSTHSNPSHPGLNEGGDGGMEGKRRRRPSMAETEPPPKLPVFSPRIPPTSYQVYERLRMLERERENAATPRMTREEWEKEYKLGRGGLLVSGDGATAAGMVKRSPRLEYARSALIERLEEWNSPSLSPSLHPVDELAKNRKFNPIAPSFVPSYTFSSPSSSSTYPHSPAPNFPSVPPNSILSSTTNSTTANSAYPSPIPPQVPNSTPRFHSPIPPSSNRGETEAGGEEMSRTSSGGVKIGGHIIEFGDFPEKIDVNVIRERAWRRLKEQERVDRELREVKEKMKRAIDGVGAAGKIAGDGGGGGGLGISVDR